MQEAVDSSVGRPAATVEAAPRSPLPRPRSKPVVWLACALEWVVPGVGYLVLGKIGRAVVAFAGVGALFVWGFLLDGQVDRPESGEILSYLATFAAWGTGIAGVVVRASESLYRGSGDVNSATFEYGTTFLRTAGLVGYLLILDVYDIASGRKD